MRTSLLLIFLITASHIFAQNPGGTSATTAAKVAVSNTPPLIAFDKLASYNLIVKARMISGGSEIDRRDRSILGETREITAIRNIQVDVVGLSENKGPVEVQFFFALRDQESELKYYRGQQENFDLDRGQWIFSTTEKRTTRQNEFFNRKRTDRGSKLVGWFVRVIQNNTIVGVAGSAPSYITTAGIPSEVDKNLGSLTASLNP